MRWSKVRKLVHESFADAVRGRVRVDATNADPRGTAWQDNCTQGWISVDGKVLAHTFPHKLRKLTLSLPGTDEAKGENITLVIAEPRAGQKIPAGAEVGTFMDIAEACWQYLHTSVNESLHSPDPLVSSLAMLSAKVGRTRLKRAQTWDLHPLTRAILDFRLEAERASAN